jgi:hypothetical protein
VVWGWGLGAGVGSFENATEMCKTIRPGLPSELPASAFQLSDTSTPTHCEYRKDASQDGDTPVGQIWVVVVVELLLLVWCARSPSHSLAQPPPRRAST